MSAFNNVESALIIVATLALYGSAFMMAGVRKSTIPVFVCSSADSPYARSVVKKMNSSLFFRVFGEQNIYLGENSVSSMQKLIFKSKAAIFVFDNEYRDNIMFMTAVKYALEESKFVIPIVNEKLKGDSLPDEFNDIKAMSFSETQKAISGDDLLRIKNSIRKHMRDSMSKK